MSNVYFKLGGQGLAPLSALPPEAVRTYLDAVKYGTEERDRTVKEQAPQDFKSCVSTNSTTPVLNYLTFFFFLLQ